jgi:hypothetical protein
MILVWIAASVAVLTLSPVPPRKACAPEPVGAPRWLLLMMDFRRRISSLLKFHQKVQSSKPVCLFEPPSLRPVPPVVGPVVPPPVGGGAVEPPPVGGPPFSPPPVFGPPFSPPPVVGPPGS